MSKSLRTNCKKVLFSLLAATCSLGVIMPVYAGDTTIGNSVSAEAGSIKVKDAILTFNEIEPSKNDGPSFLISATLERSSGIPDGMQSISLAGSKGKVTINGREYTLYFFSGKPVKKLSSTQVEIQIGATILGDNGVADHSITADLIKGNTISMPITEILYLGDQSAISKQFQQKLKSVPTVSGTSLEKSGLGGLKKENYFKGNVLPEKGLNIPICEGGRSVLDNIGFLNGKLYLRTIDRGDEALEIALVDSKGKGVNRQAAGTNDMSDMCTGVVMMWVYDIKNATALGKYTLQVKGPRVIASDREEKTVNFKFY